jgi:hypothetical protein
MSHAVLTTWVKSLVGSMIIGHPNDAETTRRGPGGKFCSVGPATILVTSKTHNVLNFPGIIGHSFLMPRGEPILITRVPAARWRKIALDSLPVAGDAYKMAGMTPMDGPNGKIGKITSNRLIFTGR